MHLDIRIPIGLLFGIIGALLVVFGLTTYGNEELYKPSLGINANLCWGAALTIFGAVMLWMAWRAKPSPRSAEEKPPERRPH